ncbi:MAG: alanine racemase [Planctomycetota bacterium]|nr:MAG: alanine racemase [Planctomycetota bacterium]
MGKTSESLGSMNITRPALILDRKRVIRNIEKMARKANSARIRFRPHFKTHQSAEIGKWFREFGVEAITVSSVDMAEYFARSGWSDITVAFIANIVQMEEINSLAGKVKLNLVVDSARTATALEEHLNHKVRVWIKVNAGYPRTGILWSRFEEIISLARFLKSSSRLDLCGLLTHSGHSYHSSGADEIIGIHKETVSRLSEVKEKLEAAGVQPVEISIGDTPTCSIVDDFAGVDEIRPGNFVFHDLMQLELGTCADEAIALAVACPIVGRYPERNQIAIYGGAAHLSKDYILDRDGKAIFGCLTSLEGGTFGPADMKARIVSLSQEHGTVQLDGGLFEKYANEDFALVFPVHSCLTALMHKGYRTMDGETVPIL